MSFDILSFLMGMAEGEGSQQTSFLGEISLRYAAMDGRKIKTFEKNQGAACFAPIDSEGNLIVLNSSLPFEVGITCNFSSMNQDVVALCGQMNSANWGTGTRAPSIVMDSYGAGIVFAISTNGSSWAKLLRPFPSGYVLPINTDIFFKMTYDGTDFSALVDDGKNVMTVSEGVGKPYYSSSYPMVFANQGQYYPAVMKYGYYDTKRLYLKQNGVLIWGRE